MKVWKKCISLIAALVLCLTGLPMEGLTVVQAAGADTVIRLKPGEAQTFHDTDGDGLGEFEGWGTSLCWWANRIGYDETLTQKAADLFFGDTGLDMNIGRYNVGGGDNVGEMVDESVNDKAQFYDLETEGRKPTYTGKKMSIGSVGGMDKAVYAVSDADFGFTQGKAVDSFKGIGYINEIGTADDTNSDGGNLHYTVNAKEAGTYTVKLLMTLAGTNNDRNAAIRVNNDADKVYVVDTDTLNSNIIASGNNQKLYMAIFSDVELNQGNNTIDIGGKKVKSDDNEWTLDFIKMAVIKSGEEGVLKNSEFLHSPHIQRSDSAVPGYAVDVTRMDLKNKTIEEYKSQYDAADEESGFAWNYDWDADKNQLNVLKAAAEASGTDFIPEAFSNSPPYFMTVSGCSSGNTDSSKDNLRPECYTAFATYMADVIKHWKDNGITFQSTTPMNEPYTTYWGANSDKQEGCHFDQGDSQSKIIVALNKALEERGITDIIISGTDETSIDTQITSYNNLSDEAKAIVDRIDTHTYGGSNRAGLKKLAEDAGKNLWMSEVDGADVGGTNAGEMGAALGLAERMMTDVKGLGSTAWILWNAIDMHVDPSLGMASDADYASWDVFNSKVDLHGDGSYWGIAVADHEKKDIVVTRKYYAYGQFSRYIRPGYTIIGSDDKTLAAYDPEGKKVVIVALNTTASDAKWDFDLSLFNEVSSDASVKAYRTSGKQDGGENWADVSTIDDIVVDSVMKTVSATVKANSITTYVISGVTYDPENPVTDTMAKVNVTDDMVTGTDTWTTGSEYQKAVDGNFNTFFDGKSGGYVIIDLQEDTEIAAVAYAPRIDYEKRSVGASIYGSTDGEQYELLYTITAKPVSGSLTFVYSSQFASGKSTYRYIKYAVPEGDSYNCNIAELSVYEKIPAIATLDDVTMVSYTGEVPELPAKVNGKTANGEEHSMKVTWDVNPDDFTCADPFDIVEVTGTVNGLTLTAHAKVLVIPNGLEYIIDSNNQNSEVWNIAKANVEGLLNKEAPDQKKTESNTWGYTMTIGDSGDAKGYDGYGGADPLYGYGWWARGGKSISYQMKLPKGQHVITVGCFGWKWGDRPMDVYYKVGSGEEQLLCGMTAHDTSNNYAWGVISLDEEADVTVRVAKSSGGDPIMSWIGVNKTSAIAESVKGIITTDGEAGLPKTVAVTEEGKEAVQKNVTWNTAHADLSGNLYTVQRVRGNVEGYVGLQAEAEVLLVPADIEYMIDSNSPDSSAWNLVKEYCGSLLNTEAADQKKTDDNAWGYMEDYGQYNGDATPYAGGWYAKSGQDIVYQVTLPAGDHRVALGTTGWWGEDRAMKVFYQVEGGEEQELISFSVKKNSPVCTVADVLITLDKEAVVSIIIRKVDKDPILSWLSISEENAILKETVAHYDMSSAEGSLTDVSGNGHEAALTDTAETDFAEYGEERVLQFNDKQYAVLPSGMIGQDGIFTIQATMSATTTSDNWLWCIGDGIGEWGKGNISDYIFVSPNSEQGGFENKILAAIKQGSESSGGEQRMPAMTGTLPTGYSTITMVSDGKSLKMYLDDKLVSTLNHGLSDLSSVIPDGEILGYIGQSLYSADQKLIANVGDMKIWNRALEEEEVLQALPSSEEKTRMFLADVRKALLNKNASESEISSDIGLPSKVDGYDLKWTVPENKAIDQSGKVTVLNGETVDVTVTVAYGNDQIATFDLTVKGTSDEDILQRAWAQLDIPNKDDVRGNVTLPSEVGGEGVTVTWEASDSDIVDVESHEASVEGYDDVPAGVVTRPASDTEVTMTATLTYNGKTLTKEIVLKVKAAPAPIAESDYTDYFFAYFAGEGYADGEQIYFASSKDGMDWNDMNENKPVLTSSLGEKGVRDPFIIRSPEGDKFYLIATDLKIYGNGNWTAAQEEGSQSLIVWESNDLVNWSEPRMAEVSASIGAGCTWAPEAAYDSVTGEYVVFWASKVADDSYSKQRVYYAKTRDFYSFTEPQVYIEKDQSSIDTTMIKDGDTYYRYTKNEGDQTNELGAKTKTIFAETGNNVLGTFTHIPSESLNENQWVEGPTIFKLNQDDAENTWCLLVDNYGSTGYYPLLTTSLASGSFTKPEDGTYQMPSRARHGTPIRITAAEYAALVEAYGISPLTKEVSATYTVEGQTPELPATVYAGGEEVAVTWNLSDVSFSDTLPYEYVTVEGQSSDGGVLVKASVQVIPKDVEYMIDSNNTDSSTWKIVKELYPDLLNADAADQPKTSDNTWGYTGVVGKTKEDGGDIVGYSQSSVSNPYTGGWWAEKGKVITYQVTLPAGEHQILTGYNGWWKTDRDMDVYYAVDDGEETFLMDAPVSSNQEGYAKSEVFTLEKKAVVTITVKQPSGDPVLSWITVTGTAKEETVIDYTELKAQIAAAEALNKDDYTPESFAAVTDALAKARALVDNAETQEEVDAAAAALKAAIDALVPAESEEPVDFSQLQEYYEANNAIPGGYTIDSYQSYVSARDAAKELLGRQDDETVTQDDVDQALANLKAAVEGLVEIDEVDKVLLQQLHDICAVIEQGDYTDESYQELLDQLTYVKDVLADENATPEEVLQAYIDLQTAYGSLLVPEEGEVTPTPPAPQTDKSALLELTEQLAKELEGIIGNPDQDKYTEDSFALFSSAWDSAIAVLEDENATQDAVDAAYDALLAAYDALTEVTVEPEPVDKTKLQELYDLYKELVAEDYTEESYQAFLEALNEAAQILNKEDATQEEIDAAYDALRLAFAALEEVQKPTADKSKLQELYDAYKDLAQGNYTAESYQALKDALAAALEVLENEDATQEEVSAAYSRLDSAIKGLKTGTPKPVPGGTDQPGTMQNPSPSPTAPAGSGTPTNSGSQGSNNKNVPNTADSSPVAGYALAALAAALTAVFTFKKRRITE